MTTSRIGDPLVELRYALADADAVNPPDRLGKLVTARAHAIRQPGRRVDEPEAISAVAVFSRAVDALDVLLDTVEADAWYQPALRDLDVQGLVGHLIGVETDFQASLNNSLDTARNNHHVEATHELALAQRDRDPRSTHRDWQLLARGSVQLLADRQMSDEISLHGIAMPLGALLIVRAFELWTHTEDIERALHRELSPPDPSSLQRMVDLAVQLLPGVLKGQADSLGPTTVRLVLIGNAGGTFDVPLVPGKPSSPRARVVADVVEFCRLVANRVHPDEVVRSMSGEVELAEMFLAGATTLALD